MLGSTNSGDQKKKTSRRLRTFPALQSHRVVFVEVPCPVLAKVLVTVLVSTFGKANVFFSPGICTWETFSTWVYIHSVWWIFCMSWDMGEGFSSVGVILANIWHCCKPLHHRFRSWCLSCRQIKTKWIIQSRIFANRCGTSYKSPQTWENQK